MAVAPGRLPMAESYFGWRRDDVLACVPRGAQNILSVGCGAGLTEQVLVERGARVTGIERDPAAADEARKRGVRVIEGDICSIDPSQLGMGFDCLIYADVLEHLAEPERVLERHIAAAGRPLEVVISVPNFRHYSVFSRLFLRGDIGYEDAGIFDRTHVRVTTRKLVQGWLDMFQPERTREHYIIHRRRDRLLNAITVQVFREFLAKQVIVTAELT